MATTSTAPKPSKAPASANLSVRLPQPLVDAAKRLAKDAGESPSDFLKVAIENEVSRRSLCQPKRPVNIEDVKRQLDLINELIARTESTERQTLATLKVIAVAMGVSMDN